MTKKRYEARFLTFDAGVLNVIKVNDDDLQVQLGVKEVTQYEAWATLAVVITSRTVPLPNGDYAFPPGQDIMIQLLEGEENTMDPLDMIAQILIKG